jgi:hypothetical protein
METVSSKKLFEVVIKDGEYDVAVPSVNINSISGNFGLAQYLIQCAGRIERNEWPFGSCAPTVKEK